MAGSTNGVKTRSLNQMLLEAVKNLKEADLDGDGKINLKADSPELAKALDVMHAPLDGFEREFSPQKALLTVLDGAVRKEKKQGSGLEYIFPTRSKETGIEISIPALITDHSIDLKEAELVLKDEIDKAKSAKKKGEKYAEGFNYFLWAVFFDTEKKAEATADIMLARLDPDQKTSFKLKTELTIGKLRDGEKLLKKYKTQNNDPDNNCIPTYEASLGFLLGVDAEKKEIEASAFNHELCRLNNS